MYVSRARASALSELLVDADLDFLSSYQVKNLAAPASSEAIRKGSKDITNAEVSDTASIAESKLDIAASITIVLTPNDNLQSSNDGQKSTQNTSIVKMKEILLNADMPICRLKFHLANNTGAYVATGRIYKNGSPIGTERTVTTSGGTTFSEDFTNWLSGDLIQLYGKISDGAQFCFIKEMRLYYQDLVTENLGVALVTPLPLTTDTISVTNQDP